MATSKSALSSLEYHTPQERGGSGSSDCIQPAAGKSKLSANQLRCCVVQEKPYLTGESRGELFSSKDVAKRKRVNRIAKLKQCKLDARREQWLSQGSRCRPEDQKQVAQHSTRKEEPVSLGITKAGEDTTAEESECQLHDAVCDEFLNEESIMTKQSNLRFFTAPYAVGSVTDHSKILQNFKVTENGKPEQLPRALHDSNSCKNKRRTGDPEGSARDSDEALEGGTNRQCSREVSGNIRCTGRCPVPSLVCFQTDHSQSCSESSDRRLDRIPGAPKLIDDEDVVLSQKNYIDVCRPGCRTHQNSFSCSSCASSSIAGSGPDVNDLSFTHETKDDWELAADALSVPGSSLMTSTSQLPESPLEGKELILQKSKVPGISNGILKPEYKCKTAGFGITSRGVGGRAWRPDDVSRPPTLPPLSKQLDFSQESSTSVWSGTQQSRNLWGPPPVPSYCPICTEELDPTDTSFFPCSCGFRLCLFCHHRISSDDGRCPGCRKIYSPDEAMKLSRTTFWFSV